MTMANARTGWAAASLRSAAAPETSCDEMLIRRIAVGDQLAMRTLFGRHRIALYRWLLRLVGDQALAEDVLSEVFLDVWRQAASFEARSSIAGLSSEQGEVIDLVYCHGKSVKRLHRSSVLPTPRLRRVCSMRARNWRP
jgi:Sigma-70 region 2